MRKIIHRSMGATCLPLGIALVLAGLVFATPQARGSCTYAITPTSRVHGYGGSTGLVTITTSSNICSWAVVNTNSWVTIDSQSNGTGDGSMGYTVASNPSLNSRSGVVMVAGQALFLSQLGIPCNFSISPASRNHGYGAATNTVALTASSNLCAWTITNYNNWIFVTSTNSGKGSATVSYRITPNPNGLERTGLVGIADQVLSLIQTSAPCVFSISPATRLHGFGAETGMVNVTTLTGCAWSAISTNSWITFPSHAEGTNSGSLSYAVAANLSSTSRTGLISVAGQLFSVRQIGSTCTFRLSPTNRVHGYGASTGLVSIIASSNVCPWVVNNTNPWIQITSSTSGTGTGTVSYAIEANPSSLERTGRVIIANQVFTLAQRGAPCTFSISPGSRTHGHGASTGLVSLTTSEGCAWLVANTNGWISINSPANNTNSGVVSYTVAANTNTTSRTGLVAIADQVLTLIQLGVPCTFSISPVSRTHGSGAATGMVSVTTAATCAWAVLNTNSWITLTSPGNGTGDGNIAYAVAANPGSTERTGLVMIADQTFTLAQHGSACTFSISPTNRAHGYGASTGLVSVTASNGCPWEVANTNAWITITAGSNGIGNGTVSYSVEANPSTLARTGEVVVVDQVLLLSQSGAPCAFTISPASRVHGSGGETGQVNVITPNECAWTMSTTNPWITITSSPNGIGSGGVGYALTANLGPNIRIGAIFLGAQSFIIEQFGTNCAYILSVTNRTHGYGASTGLVSVTAPSNCTWPVINTNSWITITSGANGVGSGNVTYAVAANPSSSDRSGAVLIGDQSLTLTQRGFVCTYSLSPTNRSHGYGATTGMVNLTTSGSNVCTWTAVTTNSWITITSSADGTGDATISYAVAANSSLSPRTGVVMIADQLLTLAQAGFACSFRLSPTNRTHGFAAATGSVNVITSTNLCAWTVSNTNGWITILSPAVGAGTGIVNYAVSANFATVSRTGVVMIGDQLLTLTQRGITNGLSFTEIFKPAPGQLKLTLAGGPGGVWELQASSDLLTWQKISNLTNTTGRMEFIDTVSNTSTQRFYRAVQQPMLAKGLSFTGAALQTAGLLKLTLAGAQRGVWDLQASADLLHWQSLASITNATGTVEFTDTTATNSSKRFYRAVQP